MKMNRTLKPILLAIGLSFALATSISAAPGDLDLSFGSGGIVVTSFAGEYWYDAARTVKVQPDGKIVVGGWISDTDNNGDRAFFLARYHPTGALDDSFGTNGKIIGPVNSGALVGADIALQPDGKIIAVGDYYPNYGFAVHRYNANGTLDASFGADGVVITPVGENAGAVSVAIQADGKIVLAGYSYSAGQSSDFTVVRLLPDGSLDTSFGGTGKVITSFGNSSQAGRVVVQPDGKIVAVGSAPVGNNAGLALVRYNADGSLDSGFGSGGKIIHGVFNISRFYLGDAALQPDGKIIASGRFSAHLSGGGSWDTIFRCNPNGSRDTSFASNGAFTVDNLYVPGIALQPDGKLIAFGYEGSGSNHRFAILRLNPNGAPDGGFGTNGRLFTPIGGNSGGAIDGALQPDGKILAVGSTWQPDFLNGDIAIVRYLGDATNSSCSSPNPIDCPDFFVSQQYRDFLGREAEAEGLQFYLDILNGCNPSDIECIRYTRGALSANFFRSPEFQRKGNFVMYLYMVSIGQRPVTASELPIKNDPALNDRPDYQEFMADLASISTPNDDPALTEQKKTDLANNWMTRPQIVSLYGSLANAQFVQKLIDVSGVTPANQTWVADLNAGTRTRAQVLRLFAESPEVDEKFSRQSFVTMEYFGFLRRKPEDCHDPANWSDGSPLSCGFIFHNHRFTLHPDPHVIQNIIVRGFIESPEYRGRFGP